MNLIVSAPFGNYLTFEGITSTIGTYTLSNRQGLYKINLIKGLLFRLHYIRKIGWINKMGLPSPGISYLQNKIKNGYTIRDKILSIHGFNDREWQQLIYIASNLKPLAVEFNVSCPNVGEANIPKNLFTLAIQKKLRIIVKLPPVNYRKIATLALDSGVRAFHCCNTYPSPLGGLSGQLLQPMVAQCIEDVRDMAAREELDIIAGGGIRNADDIYFYKNLGANKFALATLFLNPKMLFKNFRRSLIEKLQEASQ